MDNEEFRERLNKEKIRVEGLVSSLRGEIGDEPENEELGEPAYNQHPADAGSETFEREKDLGLLEQLSTELSEIEAALQRIEEGTYGIDENSGKPIPPERLEVMPTARTNVN